MEFLELVADRYSVRSFSDRPIEPEKMEKILKTGQLAPTAVNFQPQKIYILKSDEAIQKIRSLTQFAYDAPIVLLFCADMSKVWKSSTEHGYDTGEMDVSIVCTHMMLEAWALGIGSVWVRGFDSRKVAKAFELPRHIKPVCLLPIGYPSAESKPYAPWHDTYRSIEEMVEEL
jgi:nitroreductase